MQHATHQTPQKAPHQGRWVFRPPQQQGASRSLAPQQNGSWPNAPPSLRPSSTNRCFNCGDPNHFARKCPQGQDSEQNKENMDKVQTDQVRHGRINFTTLTDLPEGAPVMTGTFTIHHKPVVILFNSGASHSFIIPKFGAHMGFEFSHTRGSYMISTPGGKIASNQIIRLVPIKLGSIIIKTDLILWVAPACG